MAQWKISFNLKSPLPPRLLKELYPFENEAQLDCAGAPAVVLQEQGSPWWACLTLASS